MSDALSHRLAGFLDGDRVTPGSGKCQCRHDCEMPCWQRIGIAPTCEACKCPPFSEHVDMTREERGWTA